MILKDNYEESKVQSGALLAARYINLMLQSAQKTWQKLVVQGNVYKIQKKLYNEKSFWGFQVKEPIYRLNQLIFFTIFFSSWNQPSSDPQKVTFSLNIKYYKISPDL